MLFTLVWDQTWEWVVYTRWCAKWCSTQGLTRMPQPNVHLFVCNNHNTHFLTWYSRPLWYFLSRLRTKGSKSREGQNTMRKTESHWMHFVEVSVFRVIVLELWQLCGQLMARSWCPSIGNIWHCSAQCEFALLVWNPCYAKLPPLPSGGRDPQCKLNHYKHSFIPMAVKVLNIKMNMLLTAVVVQNVFNATWESTWALEMSGLNEIALFLARLCVCVLHKLMYLFVIFVVSVCCIFIYMAFYNWG